MVMGLLPQTEVIYLRAAPLGDPPRSSVRICPPCKKSLAQQIEVEPV